MSTSISSSIINYLNFHNKYTLFSLIPSYEGYSKHRDLRESELYLILPYLDCMLLSYIIHYRLLLDYTTSLNFKFYLDKVN